MHVPSVDVQTQKYLTLLELSKAIASHRDLSELFHDIACRLRNLFSFRDLAVMLHDGEKNVMRSYFFEGCKGDQWINQGKTEVAIDDSINGHVWSTQQPLVIRDLTQDDFALAEDGRAQTIRYFSPRSDLPLTLGLLVDVSGSQRTVLAEQRRASRQFFDKVLRKDDQAFLLVFDRQIRLMEGLTSPELDLNTTGAQGTALYDAIVAAAARLSLTNAVVESPITANKM